MEISHNQERRLVKKIFKDIKEKKSNYWVKIGQQMSLKLFKEAAKRVPAYKDFLKKNKINPDKINIWDDFQSVTPVDKKNYLKQYPLEKLCWDGTLKKPLVFTATSGSTGEPFYFPRGEQLDWQYSILAEMYLKNGLRNKKTRPSLIIIGFGMGVWIGGLITYKAFEIACRRNNLPVSIITPGVNKAEIIRAIRNLAPNFDQTILIGYPPFLKDVIDLAHNEGINFQKINIRLISAAEAFTEKFRDYLVEKAHIKNYCKDTMNIYGSADIGAMASETPLTILIRRLAAKDKKLFIDIFSSIEKTPTLAQYNPLFINFEVTNRKTLLTGDNAIPLIRYDIGDHGGVFSFDTIKRKCMARNINLEKEAKHYDIVNNINELPFVYVYERSDFSTTLYGLQIYPEFIKEALIDRGVSRFLTGKFTVLTKYNKTQDQYLEINIELQKDKKIDKNFSSEVHRKIINKLCQKSSEFKELSSHIKDKPLIELKFWPYEYQQYFKPGIKQKWILK